MVTRSVYTNERMNAVDKQPKKDNAFIDIVGL